MARVVHRSGAAYVIGHLGKYLLPDPPYKIGMIGGGGTVAHRLGEIQVGSPRPLAIAHIRPAPEPLLLERLCHKALKQYHTRGEWFTCPLSLVLLAMDQCVKETRRIVTFRLQ